jgi:hypothetical protein
MTRKAAPKKPKTLRPWKAEEMPVGALLISKEGYMRPILTQNYYAGAPEAQRMLSLCMWRWPWEEESVRRPCGVEE